MTVNIAARFKALLPKTDLKIGTVSSVNSNGTSNVLLLGGTINVVVRGTGVVAGSKCFIKDGVIQGEAPNLVASSTTIF